MTAKGICGWAPERRLMRIVRNGFLTYTRTMGWAATAPTWYSKTATAM